MGCCSASNCLEGGLGQALAAEAVWRLFLGGFSSVKGCLGPAVPVRNGLLEHGGFSGALWGAWAVWGLLWGLSGGGADSSVLEHSSWASSCCGQHEGVSSSAKVGSLSLQQHEAWIRLGLGVLQQLQLNLSLNLINF